MIHDEPTREELDADVASSHTTLTTVIGSSPRFRAALRELPGIVESPASVLLLGESGTGKEVLARKIHELSPRRESPFLAVNCAAIPAELFESELFGHVAGAFSGAAAMKRGLLELAHRGTLLLDEIADLPLPVQAKLLRVLEEKEVRRVGGTTLRKIDFRLLAATNRDLRKEVLAGRFRQDLFYRINVFILTLPPLRERADDIPELARHLIDVAATKLGRAHPVLSPSALEALAGHSWPGNIRELANVLERGVALATDRIIEPWHLGLEVSTERIPRRGKLRAVLAQVERELLVEAMTVQGGNVSAAARELGIARQVAQRLLRRHQITVAHS